MCVSACVRACVRACVCACVCVRAILTVLTGRLKTQLITNGFIVTDLSYKRDIVSFNDSTP